MTFEPRIAARALIVQGDKLLLVNATADATDGKWCTPGGRLEPGENLRACLAREVLEETGLEVSVGDIAAVADFIDHTHGTHQVDLYFKAFAADVKFADNLVDPANVVVHRRFFSLADMQDMQVFPAKLKNGFWLQGGEATIYKGFEERK